MCSWQVHCVSSLHQCASMAEAVVNGLLVQRQKHDDVLQELRQAWASPAGAEASTPGALLYHDRTPVSPANMMLLNRHPAQQSADLLAASPPPTNPSAQQNGLAGTTLTGQHAEAANGDVEASAPPKAHQSAQAKQLTPTAGTQATQGIGRANEAAALEILQSSSPAQPVPTRKPKGKGFLGGQVPDASPQGQHAPPSNAQGNSEPCQIAEHHKSPENTAQYHSAPPSCQPSALSKCPDARPAQAKSGQQPGSAQKHQQSPSMNGKSKQPTPSNAADGVYRHSPELENTSVHQAVEAVQVRQCCTPVLRLNLRLPHPLLDAGMIFYNRPATVFMSQIALTHMRLSCHQWVGASEPAKDRPMKAMVAATVSAILEVEGIATRRTVSNST